ncbi:cell wall hydrolase [Sphingomonas sp. LB-2]|uniref:cell wall hydrolase n=1 Tax=Sphingomonas caeni TaxID=2984949 RepID=UPI002231FA80|nr:cell wall hydrolase [Sphingomonas caeni]MCW3847722.1 cell wall hydrolase [Sphingomonas caeni]
MPQIKFPSFESDVPRPILAILAAIALVAVVVPALLVAITPRVVQAKVVIATRVVPKTELPKVDPVQLQAVSVQDATTINASIPFSTEPNIAARAFHLTGAETTQTRAVDCLAAAVYYEAGDDSDGERAVAQVILNRTRHPAFPKTVCGVVFQGSERSTGCQFTFTCDGSMLRRLPSAEAWTRARAVARMALTGSVDKRVGLATHYHTDWVVPYWSASLEKISAIRGSYGTHLFFRWAGWWGTPAAFSRGYAGFEPNIPQMSRLSSAHFGDPNAPETLAGAPSDALAVDPSKIPESQVPPAIPADANSFLVTLPKGMSANDFASLAIRTCGERTYCKFMAWTDGSKTPARLPLSSAQVASMSFSYLRDERQGFSKALWNCAQFMRPSPVQCMRAQPLAGPPPAPASVEAAPVDANGKPVGPAGLTGVRRRGETQAASPMGGTGPRQTMTLPVARPSTPAPSPKPTPTAVRP